jgi:caffeoyl-CoA O-methyltransferase
MRKKIFSRLFNSDAPNPPPAKIPYNDQLSRYITDLFAVQDEALRNARHEIAQAGMPSISIRPEEGRFLQFLVGVLGARKALEIGTLGGYSGIWIARGLLHGGRLITLEVNPANAEVARHNFEMTGVADRIDLRIGDAHQLLPGLSAEGPFDFVFIDAEKPGYQAYLEWAMENIRLGGVLAAHNAFRKGSVAGAAPDDQFTDLTRAFNQRVAQDSRLISTIFPAGDGTVIGLKIA